MAMDTNPNQEIVGLKIFCQLTGELRRAKLQYSQFREKAIVSLGYSEFGRDPEYLLYKERVGQLSLELDRMTPYPIRANLRAFGIEDMVVTGTLFSHKGCAVGQIEMPLSDLCGLRPRRLARKLEIRDLGGVKQCIVVEMNGVEIGRIDSDGCFNYETAPNLRTALGWWIATDGGRERVFEFFDLDRAAGMLIKTVRAREYIEVKDVFYSPYLDMIRRVLVFEMTSRFESGHCGVAKMLWRMATRETGEEHEGFSLCC